MILLLLYKVSEKIYLSPISMVRCISEIFHFLNVEIPHITSSINFSKTSLLKKVLGISKLYFLSTVSVRHISTFDILIFHSECVVYIN